MTVPPPILKDIPLPNGKSDYANLPPEHLEYTTRITWDHSGLLFKKHNACRYLLPLQGRVRAGHFQH